MSFWKYSFSAFLTRVLTLFLNFLYSGKHFSHFSLSLWGLLHANMGFSEHLDYTSFELNGTAVTGTAHSDVLQAHMGFSEHFDYIH